MSNHADPIVPAFFAIGAQKNPYDAAPMTREQAVYHTQITVRGQPPTGKPETISQGNAYCLPDDAAWQRAQATHAALSAALKALGDALRALGSYRTKLKAAGGIKQAPNPLTPTAISISDPNNPQQWWFSVLAVPRIERIALDYHTPEMLRETGKDYTGRNQRDHTVCPTDEDWARVKALHDAAETAYEQWQSLLRELGTYSEALADGRYARKQEEPMQTTTTAHTGVWHNLPPILAQWTWIGEQSDARYQPPAKLRSPDGWSTAEHEQSNHAIAEALRYVHRQARALAVAEPPIVGVAMMDAAEARACVARIKSRLDETRRDLLDLYEREGWRALGYDNWRACAVAEFGSSAATLYRQLEAAEIERDVRGDFSQLEKSAPPIPTAQLQAVKELPAADRRAAFERADHLAADGKRTTQHVQQAVDEIKPPAPLPALPPDLAAAGLVVKEIGDGFVQLFGTTGELTNWRSLAHRDFAKVVEATRKELDEQRVRAARTVLRALPQWSDNEQHRLIQEAYAHARSLRDTTAREALFAEIDRAVEGGQPPPQGPGQPEPAPWPNAPAGWRWKIKGIPFQLEAPDGWTTATYNYPERALAEAQRRILSQPKPKQAEQAPGTLTRPRRPVDASVSAQQAYTTQLEAYTAALEQLVLTLRSELEQHDRKIPRTPQAALKLASDLAGDDLTALADQLDDATYEALAAYRREREPVPTLADIASEVSA